MADQPDRNDPASQPDQTAPAVVHAMTTEYAGYINTGRVERAKMVEQELAKRGYDVNGVRLADSASLPHRVAAAEDAKDAAARRQTTQERSQQPRSRTVPAPEVAGETPQPSGQAKAQDLAAQEQQRAQAQQQAQQSSRARLEGMTVEELRAEAKTRNVATSGSKQELVDRLS